MPRPQSTNKLVENQALPFKRSLSVLDWKGINTNYLLFLYYSLLKNQLLLRRRSVLDKLVVLRRTKHIKKTEYN